MHLTMGESCLNMSEKKSVIIVYHRMKYLFNLYIHVFCMYVCRKIEIDVYMYMHTCYIHGMVIQFACDLGRKNLKDLQVSIESFQFTWFGGPICSTQINCNKKVAWDPLCCKCDITVFKYGDSTFSIETCKSLKRRMTSCRSRF